jgi:ribosomal protein S18 acetylase RimI-like enzyme
MIFLRIEKLPNTVPFNKRGYIAETCVTATFRNKKIGELLVNRALEFFKLNQCDVTELQVSVQNPKGLKFWEKFGFKPNTFHMYKTM